MALWANYLAYAIDAQEQRLMLTYRTAKRGHWLLVDDEFMPILRKHRDGTITVKRGIHPVPHPILATAVHGNLASFS
jgi:hypothetical protein